MNRIYAALHTHTHTHLQNTTPPTTMTKIAIFGLGAIGSLLSKYLLQKKENQVSFFNRSPKTSIQFSFQGKIDTFPITLSPSKEADFDWVIVCLKTYHLAEAKRSIRLLVSAKTKLAIFRNGLNLADDFLDLTKSENILETIIDAPTQPQPDGAYLQLRIPKITLPNQSISQNFKVLFSNSEIQFEIINDFKKAQWEKLIESSSLGALLALAEKPAIIFKNPKIRNQYIELIKEGIAVANSDGIKIPVTFSETLLKKLDSYPDQKGSSMLTDRLDGKKLELGAKIGVIVEIGNKNQIAIHTTIKIYNKLNSLA